MGTICRCFRLDTTEMTAAIKQKDTHTAGLGDGEGGRGWMAGVQNGTSDGQRGSLSRKGWSVVSNETQPGGGGRGLRTGH